MSWRDRLSVLEGTRWRSRLTLCFTIVKSSGIDYLLGPWFLIDLILLAALWPWWYFGLVTEMNTRDILWTAKAAGVCVADELTTFMCELSRNSGSLNLLETSGSVRACIGIPWPGCLWSSRTVSCSLCCMENCWFFVNLRAAVQRISLRKYPTMIFELCKIVNILGIFCNNKRQETSLSV